MLHRQYDELYQVAVQPVRDAASLYPNRPASPGLKERRAAAAAASSNSTTAATSAAPLTAYVPPHLRGRVGGEAVNVVAAMIADDKGRQSHKKINKARPAGNTATSAHTRGGSSSSSSSSGSSGSVSGRLHDKQHKSQQPTASKTSPGSEATEGRSQHSREGGEERKDSEEDNTGAATDSLPSSAHSSSSSAPLDDSLLSAESCEKRLRAAVKKQRQIGDLRERKAAGHQLEAGQEDKLRAAAEVDAEIERLRRRLEELRTGT